MSYAAGPVHFTIDTYADWEITLTWYTALADLTSSSGITLGGSAGTIVIKLTDTQTTAITPGPGVWDLELIDGSGIVTRFIEGTCTFTPSVTRN